MNALTIAEHMKEGDVDRIAATVERDGRRLRRWIRRNVADRDDVEDILQDVFVELVEAHRLLKPIEDVGAWLLRVARNRIVDFVRKKKPEALADQVHDTPDGESLSLEDLLPSADAGPGAAYTRDWLRDELEDAVDALPVEQRDVFLAHEVSGQSFKEISARTGVSVNTLISRKHYAVLQLRRRLQAIYDEILSE
jgi:RNA polymerase sigma factor (sigma-70 family)